MTKHKVTESFIDKDTKLRYEKGGIFEGNKTRCGSLMKKGFLSDEIEEEPKQPEPPEQKQDGTDGGTGSEGK